MKKIFSMFVFILLLTTTIAVAQEEEIPDAGITPDSMWWGIDVALDKIALALTFNKASKAEKGLKIAEERLLEIKAMATEKKIKAMAKAEGEHGKVVVKIKEAVEKIEEDDPTEEVKTVIKLEMKIGKHEANLEEVRQKIDIKIKGELTEEQQAMIDSVLSNLEGQTGELKIKVINKKDKTKIKIKVKTGKSEIEIEKEVEDIEDEAGLTRDRTVWAQKAIEHAEGKIATAEEKIAEKIAEGFNTTMAENYLAQAKDMLAQAKEKLNIGEHKEARKLAQEAGKLAMRAKRGKSFEKIEVEEEVEEEIELEKALEKINKTKEKLMELQEKGVDVSKALEELARIEAEFKEGLFTGDLEEALESIEDKAKAKEKVEEEEEVECITAADCKEGEICIDEKCKKVKEEKKPECVVDANCKGGEVCVEGKCKKSEE